MKYALLALTASALLAGPAVAQDSTPQERVEDEVIVEGVRKGGDPAMDAFLRGDYVTAEIEFEKNFSRLKRFEYLRESSIQDSVRDAISSQVNANANVGTAGGQNEAGSSQTADAFSTASPVYINKRDVRDDPNTVRSGTDLGAQIYMAGLSELNQGKLDEAVESFERALKLNKTLHDARYRLGLISIALGKPEDARKHLTRMERELRGCYARCESLGDREILETGISELKRFLGEA